MHWSDHGHDPRQIDLLAVVVLILVSLGAFVYLASSYTSSPPSRAAFIVPSQNVRW
jgi:hypothetical protein